MRWGRQVAVAGLLLVACGDDEAGGSYSSTPPTRAEAEALLATAVDLARAGDLDALCQLTIAETGCATTIADVGPPPGDRPVVVETRTFEERSSSAGVLAATRVLGVCVGDRYTEVMVLRRRDTGEAELVSPVYWSGTRAAESSFDDDGNAVATVGGFQRDPC